MKKTLFLVIMTISFLSYGQREIKLDVADILGIKTLELSYEYYIRELSSIGFSALVSFEKKTVDFRYNEDQMLTPYFRHYFTPDRMWNLFGELFSGINLGSKKVKVNDVTSYENYFDTAFGIGIGAKYITEGGLTIDAHAGVGRNLFSSDSPLLVPRAGINVGLQF